MGQTAVQVELDGFVDIYFAGQVFFLKTLGPTQQSVGVGVGVVQEDRVLGVHLGLGKLVGVDLQPGDFDIGVNVLGISVDGRLVDLNRLQVFAFCRQGVRLLDEGRGVPGGGGSGHKGRIHNWYDHQVEVEQEANPGQ